MSIISKKNSSKKSLQSNTFIEKEEHFLHWTADKGGSWGLCFFTTYLKSGILDNFYV